MKSRTILVLVNSNFHGDGRVVKQVQNLLNLGYRVKVIGISSTGNLHRENWQGVEILLLPLIPQSWKRFIQWKNRNRPKPNSSGPAQASAGPPKKPHRPNLLPPLLFAFAMRSVPRDYLNDIALIHAHDILTLLAGRKLAKKLKVPFIFDSHEYEVGLPFLGKTGPLICDLIQKIGFKQVSRVITVAEPLAEQLKKDYPGILTEVIHNSPVITEVTSEPGIKTSLSIPEQTPLVLYIGNLTPIRGLEEIMGAMKHLPGYQFANLNQRKPTLDQTIQLCASRHGVSDALHLPPGQSHDKIVSYISDADVGVIATHMHCKNTEFALPNKLFEMLFAKVPVVYYGRMKAIQDLMRHYQLGVEIDEVSPHAIARGIREVVENPSRYTLSEDIHQDLLVRYGAARQRDTLQRIYAEVLKDTHE